MRPLGDDEKRLIDEGLSNGRVASISDGIGRERRRRREGRRREGRRRREEPCHGRDSFSREFPLLHAVMTIPRPAAMHTGERRGWKEPPSLRDGGGGFGFLVLPPRLLRVFRRGEAFFFRRDGGGNQRRLPRPFPPPRRGEAGVRMVRLVAIVAGSASVRREFFLPRRGRDIDHAVADVFQRIAPWKTRRRTTRRSSTSLFSVVLRHSGALDSRWRCPSRAFAPVVAAAGRR